MKKQKKAFSIIIAIFMTGFLMVLTIGVLNLVLREMKDNKGNENYLKAYSSAEGAMEVALLKIKNNSYSYQEELLKTSSGAESLSFKTKFNKNNDPKISYKIDIKTQNYTGVIGTGAKSTIIIPLFWKDQSGTGKTTKLELNNINFLDGTNAENDIIWNILGGVSGMSGTGVFDENKKVTIQITGTGEYLEHSTEELLERNNINYLILFNKNQNQKIKFNLKTKNINDYFSNPYGKIISSVTVGKYKQNISTEIDNTEFLKMLKYSLYNN